MCHLYPFTENDIVGISTKMPSRGSGTTRTCYGCGTARAAPAINSTVSTQHEQQGALTPLSANCRWDETHQVSFSRLVWLRPDRRARDLLLSPGCNSLECIQRTDKTYVRALIRVLNTRELRHEEHGDRLLTPIYTPLWDPTGTYLRTIVACARPQDVQEDTYIHEPGLRETRVGVGNVGAERKTRGGAGRLRCGRSTRQQM